MMTHPASSTPPTSETNRPDDRVLNSEELLRGQTEVLIRHGEQFYRLRQTRSGKLILQK